MQVSKIALFVWKKDVGLHYVQNASLSIARLTKKPPKLSPILKPSKK